MRVNKQVVSYVTQKVNELADVKRKPLAEELEAIEERNRKAISEYRSDVAELGKRCSQEIGKLLKKHGLKLRYPDRVTGKFWCIDSDAYGDFNVDVDDSEENKQKIKAINGELDHIRSDVKCKVDEIIARLSLGGTAGDLDQMLSAVSF